MYALLLPSAHSFISSVEEKVNVELRQISVPTGAPTPCLFGSPACTERVCGPHFCVLEFFIMLELLAVKPIPSKHHFGALRNPAFRLRRPPVDQREVCGWRLLFQLAHWGRSRSEKIPWCRWRVPAFWRSGHWRRSTFRRRAPAP